MNDLIYNIADWAESKENERIVFAIIGESEEAHVNSNTMVLGNEGLILGALSTSFKKHPNIRELIFKAITMSIVL